MRMHRRLGRWFGTLVVLSLGLSCLLVLASWGRLDEEAVDAAAPRRRLLTSQSVQMPISIATTTKGIIKYWSAGPSVALTRTTRARALLPSTTKKPKPQPQPKVVVAGLTQQRAKPTQQPDLRSLCWKSGYSPASGRSVNHTPGGFLINADRLCGTGRLTLLVIVLSQASARVRRDLARRTWASLNSVNGRRLAIVFVVGTPGGGLSADLRTESAETTDLVQVPCGPDGDPRGSACKVLYSLLWAGRHCPRAEFLMKVDDHVFVNVFHVAALVTERLAGAKNTFYCGIVADEVRITSGNNYWHVPGTEWPEARYPTHCKGLAYLMSGDLAPRLLGCAAWRNYLRLEDTFVTGVLGRALGARLVNWHSGWGADWLHPKYEGPAVATAIVLASPDGAPLPSVHRRLWRAALVWSADFF